jgi:hypothetical protein
MAWGEKFDFVGTLIIEYCSLTFAGHSERRTREILRRPDEWGLLRMTLINKKGGDAYGKVPKRIAIAKRQGEEKNAWPGQIHY